MVDVAGLSGVPTAADFTFRVGNDNHPSGWSSAPAPSVVAVRSGAVANGADRITLIWSDRAIQKQWLEVTVLATSMGMPLPHEEHFSPETGARQLGHISGGRIAVDPARLALSGKDVDSGRDGR